MIVRRTRTVLVSITFLLLLSGLTEAWAQEGRRLTLQQAIELAGQRRAEVADAELDVKLARLGVVRAGLDRIRVRLEGQWGEQVERLHVNAPPALCESIDQLCQPAQRRRVLDLSASVEIPVWSGFELEAGWSRARALERAALARQRGRWRSLALEVAAAYWTVRHAELLRDAARRALERRRDVAGLIKVRADSGLAARSDSDRAEIAALRQQALVAELDGQAALAHTELATALQVEGELELADDPAARAPILPPLPALLAEAEERPELAEARAESVASEQSLRVARGGLWPHLDLFARAEARNEALGIPQPNLIGHFMAGVQLRWRVLDSFTTWQGIRIADVERHRRSLEEQRIRVQVMAEVRTAYSQLASALSRREPLTRALGLARSALDAVRRRYQSGSAIFIEVLEAEDELSELEAAVSTSAVDLAQAEAALTAARGAGSTGASR